MEEEWKECETWPGYSVSNFGGVKSNERKIIRKNGWPHTTPARVLATHKDSQGYLQFHPYKDKKRYHVLVHRTVFETFVRPLEPGEHVDHIDVNPLNNRVDNLQAVSGHKEHYQHTWGRIFKKHYDRGYKDGYEAGYVEGQCQRK